MRCGQELAPRGLAGHCKHALISMQEQVIKLPCEADDMECVTRARCTKRMKEGRIERMHGEKTRDKHLKASDCAKLLPRAYRMHPVRS